MRDWARLTQIPELQKTMRNNRLSLYEATKLWSDVTQHPTTRMVTFNGHCSHVFRSKGFPSPPFFFTNNSSKMSAFKKNDLSFLPITFTASLNWQLLSKYVFWGISLEFLKNSKLLSCATEKAGMGNIELGSCLRNKVRSLPGPPR